MYSDGVHLMTDGPLEELHEFAERIGMKRSWFQDLRHKHYDLMSDKTRKAAIKHGATFVDSKTLIRICHRKTS